MKYTRHDREQAVASNGFWANTSCQQILGQLMGIRSAAHQASLILAKSHALGCLRHPDQSMSTEEIVNSVIVVLAKMPCR